MQMVVYSLLQIEQKQERNFPSPVKDSAGFRYFLLLVFMPLSLNSGGMKKKMNYVKKKK